MADQNLGWRWGIVCCQHCRQLSIVVLPAEEHFIECPKCDRITRLVFRRASKGNMRRVAAKVWVFERVYFDELRKGA